MIADDVAVVLVLAPRLPAALGTGRAGGVGMRRVVHGVIVPHNARVGLVANGNLLRCSALLHPRRLPTGRTNGDRPLRRGDGAGKEVVITGHEAPKSK